VRIARPNVSGLLTRKSPENEPAVKNGTLRT